MTEVSYSKMELRHALKKHPKGIYPGAFCKILPDVLLQSNDHAIIMHSDGIGTKGIWAELWHDWCGSTELFASLAQDVLAMNLNDMACAGATGPFIVTNVLSRSDKSLPVVNVVIDEFYRVARVLTRSGVKVIVGGGETEEVPGVVSKFSLSATAVCRLPRSQIIDTAQIQPGDVIIGIGFDGVGCNGHSTVREYYHDIDDFTSDQIKQVTKPTPLYVNFLKDVIQEVTIHGAFHCTGGGQTKCLWFGNDQIVYVKDKLFDPPQIFKDIQRVSGMDWLEMYKRFHMGHLLEIICAESEVLNVLTLADVHDLEAGIIGHCERGGKQVVIQNPHIPMGGTITHKDLIP